MGQLIPGLFYENQGQIYGQTLDQLLKASRRTY